MTDLPALSYLHPNHPLLREIQERDFEIARLHRVIAATDAKIAELQAGKRRIADAIAAARRPNQPSPTPSSQPAKPAPPNSGPGASASSNPHGDVLSPAKWRPPDEM